MVLLSPVASFVPIALWLPSLHPPRDVLSYSCGGLVEVVSRCIVCGICCIVCWSNSSHSPPHSCCSNKSRHSTLSCICLLRVALPLAPVSTSHAPIVVFRLPGFPPSVLPSPNPLKPLSPSLAHTDPPPPSPQLPWQANGNPQPARFQSPSISRVKRAASRE